MTLVTFGVRYPVLALVRRVPLPSSLLDALKFVPPAVLTAIVVPALLAPDGGAIQLSPANAYLVGGLIAGLVAWRSQNLLLTIVAGMVGFWLWRWLVGWLMASGW
jgi:branched-subunit amino acid transport protein